MNSRDSLPQRALEMSRRTGKSIDDCLFVLACDDAEERRRAGVVEPEVQGRVWTPRVPKGRMTEAERNG